MEEASDTGLILYSCLKSNMFWLGFSYACCFMFGLFEINKKFGKTNRKNFIEKCCHLFGLCVVTLMFGAFGIVLPFIMLIKGNMSDKEEKGGFPFN